MIQCLAKYADVARRTHESFAEMPYEVFILVSVHSDFG